MQLKTASAIAIASLSISAMVSLIADIHLHYVSLQMGMKVPWFYPLASVARVLLFDGSLILFFVVVYRKRCVCSTNSTT